MAVQQDAVGGASSSLADQDALDMSSFIDLVGASGVTYRFRAWSDAGQSPMAGNFVAVDRPKDQVRIVMAGVIGDLSRAPTAAATAGCKAEEMFVRLNVSGQTRSAEHEDLVANHRPAKVYDSD